MIRLSETEKQNESDVDICVCTFPATSNNSTSRLGCLSTFNAVVNCLLLLVPAVDVLSLNPLRLIIFPVLLSASSPLSMPVSPRYESLVETDVVDNDSMFCAAAATAFV